MFTQDLFKFLQKNLRLVYTKINLVVKTFKWTFTLVIKLIRLEKRASKRVNGRSHFKQNFIWEIGDIYRQSPVKHQP